MAEEIQAPESVPPITNTVEQSAEQPEVEPTVVVDKASELPSMPVLGGEDRTAFQSLTPDAEVEVKTVPSEEKTVKVRVTKVEMTPDEAEKVKAALFREAEVIGKEQQTQLAYNTVCEVAISVLPALIPTISWKKDTPKEYDALMHGLCKQALELGLAMTEEIFSASKSISERCVKIIEKGSDDTLATPDGPVPEPAN